MLYYSQIISFLAIGSLIFSCNNAEDNLPSGFTNVSEPLNPIANEIISDYPANIDFVIEERFDSIFGREVYKILNNEAYYPARYITLYSGRTKTQMQSFIDRSEIYVNVDVQLNDEMEKLVFVFDSEGKYQWGLNRSEN